MIVFLAAASTLSAQGPEWVVYTTLNSGLPNDQVQAIAVDSAGAWIGTSDGLARLDGGGWHVYDTSNTPLPSAVITALSADGKGGVWVGTDAGIARFDGAVWSAYTPANSPVPAAVVTSIAAVPDGSAWVGTENGLLRWDGSEWTLFNDSTSSLFEDLVRSVAVDSGGTVWFGTFDPFNFQGRIWNYDGIAWNRTRLDLMELPSSFPDAVAVDSLSPVWLGTSGTTGGALARIAGTVWTIFDHVNSGMPGGGVSAVVLEDSLVWIGTADGLVSFDGTTWALRDAGNSGLPDDVILDLAIDPEGNKWIGTLSGGVAVYKEGGVVTAVLEGGPGAGPGPMALRNFPNPFNPATTIRYSVHTAGPIALDIYDLIGRRVARLAEGYAEPGEYEAVWDAGGLGGGMFVARLTVGSESAIRKLLLLR